MEVTSASPLELLVLVANTAHGPGGHHHARAHAGDPSHDHLVDPADVVRFLADHDVAVPDGLPAGTVLARLASVRDAVRQLAAGRLDGLPPELDEAFASATYRLGRAGTLRSTRGGWDGLADELLAALLDLVPRRDRLRVCGNALCGWVFLDRSRNGSRVWCDMAACGNRAKVARHRLARARAPVAALRRSAPSRGARPG
jgi:predicted RNA-binding Zn ribbon-like protein